MTRTFKAIAALTLTALTGCLDLDTVFEIPVGNDYCLGVGVGVNGDEVDWADVTFHECIPDGYYTCDSIDVGYTGAFGGASCQGAYNFPDAYSLQFSTSSNVTHANIEWQTDMMDSPKSEDLYPVHVDESNYLYVVHFPNPGYDSDGDRIDFTIRLYSGDMELQDPVVSATLNDKHEDVDYDADDREYSSRW